MLLLSLRKIPSVFLSLLLLSSFTNISHASYFQPDESEARIKEAVKLMSSGRQRDAEKLLSGLMREYPSNGRVLLLFGKLYLSEGENDKAEPYLKKAEKTYPLLKDYALKLRADAYINSEKYEKALDITALIKSSLLKKDVMLVQIRSLLALNRGDEAISVLYKFINAYPREWNRKWMLAKLLRERSETGKAVKIYKDLFISASPLFMEARRELKPLKADIVTKRERLKMADNFYKRGEYRLAESNYRKVMTGFIDPLRRRIKHQMAMCRFRLKDYDRSADIFGSIETARAKYWQARSLYRADRFGEFIEVLSELEKKYPHDKHYAMALFIYADDFRRKGDEDSTTKIFNKIIDVSPSDTEEAMWGIAWMNYTEGNYGTALEYLTGLTEYQNSSDYQRYIYWRAKSIERMNDTCINSEKDDGAALCEKISMDFLNHIDPDESYYGYLIRFNYGVGDMYDKASPSIPQRPDGESLERIEALALLGMKDEAVNEITAVLSKPVTDRELLYLGYLAMEVDEYNSIIRFAERAEGKDFLPLSYPLAYWDIIKQASEAKGIDPYLVEALIREESRFDPMALSWAGAYGLMQIVPATADRMNAKAGVTYKKKTDLYLVEKNILIGINYLSLLLNDFEELPFSIASYNAGENAVRGWRERYKGRDLDETIEDLPYQETRRYVKKVLKSYWRYRTLYGLDVEGY